MDLEKLTAMNSRYLGLMARIQQVVQRNQMAKISKGGGSGEFSLVDFQSIMEAYAKSMPEFLQKPEETAARMQQFWMDWTNVWKSALTGEGADEEVKDKRFKDVRWSEDPVARTLRNAHLVLEQATDDLLSLLPENSKEALRVRFYTRQFLSAIAPSNFLPLNPVARDRLLETEGQSLLDGLENLVDDLEKGDGRLAITTTDPSAFKVGEDLATTPGKVIYQNKLMQLIQYAPMTETQKKRPLLFVPPWINKFYIFDMRPDNSMVRYMVEQGHTVFLISWVNPTKEHAEMTFDDYMKLGPLTALEIMEKATGEEKFDILGFCLGGILVMSTLALLAERGDDRIVTASTLTTMVDFTDVGEVGVFVDRERLKVMREHVQEKGFLENHHLRDMFSMMRENDLIWSFHVMNYLMGRKPPAFDMLYWNSDSTRLPAAMLLWYLEKIYIENGLRKPGCLSLDGTPIDIAKIKTPLFVLATKEDHIAPWPSVYPTTGLTSGEVKFVLGGSGHIAGVMNPPSGRPRYGYWVRDDYPESNEEWLAGAEHREGSWWPEWLAWIDSHGDEERVPARQPGDGGIKPIEDAPGSYVLAK